MTTPKDGTTKKRKGVSTCQDCGKTAALRPYGKGGMFVCFSCAMKDEKEAERRFGELLNKGTVVIDTRNHQTP